MADGGLHPRPLAGRASKLTLSLGLRFEYYPLMTRADKRHRAARLQHLRGAARRARQHARGRRASTSRSSTSRPASAPCIGSATRRCCAPATAAPSTRCPGRGRCADRTPTTSSTTAPPSSSATWAPSNGHPRCPGARPQQRPRQAAGEHVHALAQHRRRGPRGPAAGERGRRAAPAVDLSLEVAFVHGRSDGGYADRNVNYGEPGGGQAARQLLLRGRHHRRLRLGRPHQAALQRAAGGAQPPVPATACC